MSTGVAAMVQLAAWSDTMLGTETLFIGRHGLDRKDSCTLELSGRQLLYVLFIDGNFVFFKVCPMDTGDALETLLSGGDTADGWTTLGNLLRAFEQSGINSLKDRPIELGEGKNGIVIS
jgi:hypothetical protein